jgi:hypothetical protein
VLKDFYLALAPVSFTLLGLWMIVAQTRHADWRHSPLRRRQGYAVWLNFALPGFMALLSLVDSANEALWRVSFAVVAAIGVALLLGLSLQDRGKRAFILYGPSMLLYMLIALIAIVPAAVNDLDASINALRTEAILLSIVVFVGVNLAWYLLFENDTPPR